MSRRSSVLLLLAALVLVVTVGGGVIALLHGEPLHAAAHALLGVAAAYVVGRLVARHVARQ